MSDLQIIQPRVVRTERGLSIAGTRITLYDVMDYLKADWPPKLRVMTVECPRQTAADQGLDGSRAGNRKAKGPLLFAGGPAYARA